MDTLAQAADYLHDAETPFWWVFSGNNKIAQNVTESDMNASVALFKSKAAMWPAGSYKLECANNAKDRAGSFKFPFVKASGNSQQSTPMVQSNNAYGIADHVLKQIQEDARRTLLFEQMADKFGPMVELVKDMDTRLKRVEKILADEDGDGEPDLLTTLKKGSELVKAGSEFKDLFA